MNLQIFSNTELCQRMEQLVRSERKITHLVLIHILEIETRKIYADLGFDSMYAYLIKHLGYGESSAYRRLQSARLLRQIPVIAEKLESGSLNLSQTTKLQKCLRDQKQKGEVISECKAQELIAKLENKNTFETEKVLALEFNKPVQIQESLKPQKDDSVRLEVTFSSEQYQDLLKAKELLSHICPDGTWAEVLATLAKKFNQSKQGKVPTQTHPAKPVKQIIKPNESTISTSKPTTQSFVAKHDKKESKLTLPPNLVPKTLAVCRLSLHDLTPKSNSKKINSRYRPNISIKAKRELMQKANYCCQYQDVKTKNKCHSTYQLEIDHIQPLAIGGSNSTGNLRVLCRTHNALMAQRSGLNYCEH